MLPYRHRQVGTSILVLVGIPSVVLVIMALLGEAEAVMLVVLVMLVAAMILFGSLTVEVRSDALVLWFGPGVVRKRFDLAAIRGVRTVENAWLAGWGVRRLPNGWLYNVSGLDAVELEMEDGKRHRIGTDRPRELETALREALGDRSRYHAAASRAADQGLSAMQLRFTGEWPPPGLLSRYPNWENALDEEDVPGQDETTLRPAEEQQMIPGEVAYTAGEIVQADGTRRAALIALDDDGPNTIFGYVTESDGWTVMTLGKPSRWSCIVEDWKPEAERSPSVRFDDPLVFPLVVRSRLPLQRSGRRVAFRLGADGSYRDLGGDPADEPQERGPR